MVTIYSNSFNEYELLSTWAEATTVKMQTKDDCIKDKLCWMAIAMQ